MQDEHQNQPGAQATGIPQKRTRRRRRRPPRPNRRPDRRRCMNVSCWNCCWPSRRSFPLPLSRFEPEEMEHPGLRKVLARLYRLQAEGQPPDLDHLREPLDNERLWDSMHDLHDRGLDYADRHHVFQKVLERFRERETSAEQARNLESTARSAGRSHQAGSSAETKRTYNNRTRPAVWLRTSRFCEPRQTISEASHGTETGRGPEGPDRIGQGKRLPDLQPGQRIPARRRRQSREARSAPDAPRRTGHRADRRIRGRGTRGAAPRAARPDDTKPSCASSTSASSTKKATAAASTIRAHVPHADGRDPAAHPRGGNRAGQEDRSHPQALPPQGARMRLRPAQRRRDAQARPRRRPAVRPHDQGLAHREPRKRQDPPAHAAQPEDARTPARAERRRLQQEHRRARSARKNASTHRRSLQDPPPQGGHAGRRAVDPHAEGPAADEEAGADLACGWTSWSSRSKSCKGMRTAKEDRANLRERTARPDAA